MDWQQLKQNARQALWPGTPVLLLMLAATSSLADTPTVAKAAGNDKGRKVYDFYCYQCHGYSGDARTLASTYLDPQPRNFAATDPEALTQERMLDAVTHGRAGTAMVSFASVISADEIDAVVGYIRNSFMQQDRPNLIYHTRENGWEDHDRYAPAFPFASGEIPLDRPWEQLTEQQRHGRTLFMQSCITCHDRAVVEDEGAIWELRALSYPRKHYSHRMDMDSISAASPYRLHDQLPDTSMLSEAQQRGAALFQQNCAFCHGADATGRNWIGSFLEPHARDLTAEAITQQATERLAFVIRNGLEGTSMPAWKHVLSDDQIDDVITYLKRNQTDQTAIQQ